MTGAADWLGRSRRLVSGLDPWAARALHASIDSPAPPVTDKLPLLWHWLYFLETPGRDQQGADGHPRKGEFFPPIDNPRRMFVGARSRLHAALELGRPAELVERIERCENKRGRHGEMTLLTLACEYRQDGVLCVEEQRDFMYLPARNGEQVEARVQGESAVPAGTWSWDVPTDPVLLFKFSALTFNGHRIHYDRDYAREVEGYPDCVVHGPMTALLLAELVRAQAGQNPVTFSFRARAPLYVGDRLRLRADPQQGKIALAAYRPDGQVAMTAEMDS